MQADLPPASVAVVAALPEEIRATRARLQRCRRVDLAGATRGWWGTIADVPVLLALTGEGAARAEHATRALLSQRARPGLLVVMGLGGGLDARLHAADLVVAARVVRSGGEVLRPDEALLERSCRAIDGVRGWIATVDRVISTAREKRVLGQRWLERLPRGDPGPGAVDLESWWTVASARAHGVPWVAIRAIGDPVDDDLPALIEASRDRDGAIARHRVLLRAVRSPTQCPTLLRLGWRSKRCARALAEAIERLVKGLRGLKGGRLDARTGR